jgi:hypothetical protein
MATKEKVFACRVLIGGSIWKISWIKHCKRLSKYVRSASAPELMTFSQIKGYEEIPKEEAEREAAASK